MAIVKPTLATPSLSGKIGGVIYATQPDGTVIARGVGKRRAPFTPGEKRAQERMKLAHQYLRGALADPALRTAYEEEARRINARTRSVAIADFLTDPVIDGIDDTLFTGAAGCCLLP